MILEEQENGFLFEFGLIEPVVLNVYFDIISADVVYHLQKSYPQIPHFCFSQGSS